MEDVIIIGAGIGGLTLALSLARVGIHCRIFEAASKLEEAGAGINLLPHATRELAALGLEEALASSAIATRERLYFNRYGQLVCKEPLGFDAGFEHRQFSIHRADLQQILLNAVRSRLGTDRIVTGQRCTEVVTDNDGVVVHLVAADTEASSKVRGRAVVGADGIHSAVRRQFYPSEGAPRYSGVNMWRGVTKWQPILGGATMILAGCLATGQTVIYPIRDKIDGENRQLVNWVFEMETPKHRTQDWNREGRLEDVLPFVADWQFDWLNVPAFLRHADTILEFPMVDRDPLPRWSFGCVTLLGDAAHPMVPRGSNGAGQAILDAVTLADCLEKYRAIDAGFIEYERQRREHTSRIVLTNRSTAPDVMLNEVHRRTGDKPFHRIEDVISEAEMSRLVNNYKHISDTREHSTKNK